MSSAGHMAFFVEPAEPLIFGPPKSFTAGEGHRLRSQFPPPPMAFQGMIRTRLLLGAEPALDLETADPASIAALVGSPAELPDGWQIQGPFPARRIAGDPEAGDPRPLIQPWVPAPRFLLRDAGDPDRVPLHVRAVMSTHEFHCDREGGMPLFLGRPDAPDAKPLSGWLSPANLRFALGGGGQGRWQREGRGTPFPPFVREEDQPGLAIDPVRGTASHGLLYFAQALRFAAGGGLFGSLSAPSLPSPLSLTDLTRGAGQAGRKRRPVGFSAAERLDPDWQAVIDGAHLPETVEEDRLFWLLALTPVRLADPLHPDIRADLPPGLRVDILAALTGRAQAIGGLEMASGRPRPNRLYVPAGSAWAFRVEGGTAAQRRHALSAMHDRHCLGEAAEAAMGFGHTLVGLGPLTTEDAP